MITRIDWDKPTLLKIERSETFWPWGENAVDIFRKENDGWKKILPDFSPSVLRWCHFPISVCRAAALTAEDGHVRLVDRGKIVDKGEKIALVTRKKVVKVGVPNLSGFKI